MRWLIVFAAVSVFVGYMAPAQEIPEDKYMELVRQMPDNHIPWDDLVNYEGTVDTTEGSREWACTGDKCEIV